MTIRRLLLIACTATILIGTLGMTAADAAFGDSAALPAMSVSSTTVAAPTGFTGSLACGSSNSTMSASWTASSTPRISGYLITVYFSDGYTQTVSLASTATSWSASITSYNVTAYKVQYSVTTQTSYGWTKESAKTAWFGC
jgi:hypothetical protein